MLKAREVLIEVPDGALPELLWRTLARCATRRGA